MKRQENLGFRLGEGVSASAKLMATTPSAACSQTSRGITSTLETSHVMPEGAQGIGGPSGTIRATLGDAGTLPRCFEKRVFFQENPCFFDIISSQPRGRTHMVSLTDLRTFSVSHFISVVKKSSGPRIAPDRVSIIVPVVVPRALPCRWQWILCPSMLQTT